MMRVVLLLIAATVCNAALFEQCDKLFSGFKSKFHVSYPSSHEEVKRKGIFCDNMKLADELNVKNGHASFGVSKYADKTSEEFSVVLGRKGHGKQSSKPVTVRSPKPDFANRDAGASSPVVNWLTKGKVTPVKNQGQCGSCWAHSVTEQIESQFAINGNALWEFSVQQVTSCTPGTFGCGGGDTVAGYDYLMSLPTTEGLGSSAFAPYTQSMYEQCTNPRCTESCGDLNLSALQTYSSLTGFFAQVTGFDYATPPCTDGCAAQNMTLMAQNIQESGPASICVNAGTWNLYTGGVLTQAACGGYAYDDLDHCVQVVGYNSEAASPYWIVRNSWATDWGNNGYIYLEYGPSSNTCGLGNEATFVTLSTDDINPSRSEKCFSQDGIIYC